MLKAGFSRVDVTPSYGMYIAGYFHDRYAEEILDPIYLNAIAISDGDDTALIITADLLGMQEQYLTPIRNKIAELVGIKPNNIIISSLHQHTSVRVPNNPGKDAFVDRTYFDMLDYKFCDAAKMAIADMSEATLGLAEKETAEQIAFVRRYRMKDGSIKTNPSPAISGEISHPIDDPDNTVRLLRFFREGKNDIALVNFSTHPDVVGGSNISADWPGFTRTYVEADHKDVSCILINGVQGDSNHFNPYRENRGVRKPNIEHAKYMGRVIADAVSVIWDKTEPCDAVKINGAVDFTYQMIRTDGVEYYDECVEMVEALKKKMSVSADALERVGGAGGARRIVEMHTSSLFKKVAISAIGLGKINFVGFGGEPFTHYAKAVREALPEKYIIALCCANGYDGYLPTEEALSNGGGYEANTSHFHPTIESDCVNMAVNIIKSFE